MADTLERFIPALSATSDAPDMGVLSDAPAPALSESAAVPDSAPAAAAPAERPAKPAKVTAEPVADEATIETETAEAETAEASEETAAPVETKPEQEPKADKEPSGVGKALEAQRALIQEAQQRAFAAEQRAAEAIRAMEALSARIPQPQAAQEPADPRPMRDGYDSPEAYDQSLIAWSGRQAARAVKAELETQATMDREAAAKKAVEDRAFLEAQEVELKWAERRVKAIEKNPDFESVTTSNDLPITQVMASYIKQNDNGPDLAYHLGKNIAEAKRISGLHPAEQIAELAVLNHTLKTPKSVVTKAPSPIRPHRPSSSPANQKTPDEMSVDEYAAYRMASIRASARKPGSPVH